MIFANRLIMSLRSLFFLGVYFLRFKSAASPGYSDIAIGAGKILGFNIPKLILKTTYLASSSTDLWRRWHISLSTWLRLYYITLGNRVSLLRNYFNVFLQW